MKTIFKLLHSKNYLLPREFLLLAALTSALLLFPGGTYAAEVSLAWDANSETDLAGYNIYYGTASHDYTHRINVGNVTEYTVLDLDDDGTYYFAATAYDRDGNESAYSEELVYTCSLGKPIAPPSQDSDGDGVSDDRDDFPFDPDESSDTDGDGLGNNADSDDDNDGMPDIWESQHGLNPLMNDASADSDGDGNNNLNEYLAGTDPNTFEDSSPPDTPAILVPYGGEIVSLTPELKADVFHDPDPDDLHAESQWQIFRADDDFCVYDVLSPSSLTSLSVPKLILEADVDYIWRVRFFNNHGAASDWSDDAAFTTDLSDCDLDGNGIPDHQEVDASLDLDQDDVMDQEQDDIKCVDTGNDQIGLSVRDAVNLDSLISLEIEDPDIESLANQGHGEPTAIQYGLLSFKLRVNAPGDETVVTIYLSNAAADHGKWYKYDSVNDEWLDYSEYIEFGPDRKVAYLSLKDGGFGDADGIENGIIVDPLAFGMSAELDPDNHAVSSSDTLGSDNNSDIFDKACFISIAASRPDTGHSSVLWPILKRIDLQILIIVMLLVYSRKVALPYHR